MSLIYLSPVPWASFAQRPHHFVRWFHDRTGGPVLWIEPYPTRLPAWDDLARVRQARAPAPAPPVWLEVVAPRALPVDPLPAGRAVNAWLWRGVIDRARDFSQRHRGWIVVGKPSALALQCLSDVPAIGTAYDAMDDFPAFYVGRSRRVMARVEAQIGAQVGRLLVSSTSLLRRWQTIRPEACLVPNGLDEVAVRRALDATPPMRRGAPEFVYVGTLGRWFDWAWLRALADGCPHARVRIVGPLSGRSPVLPGNVTLEPAVAHDEALAIMRAGTVGLIPFLRTDLTASVDPIKYYEYRALGLPVLSTRFGEMAERTDEPRTFVSDGPHDAAARAGEAAALPPVDTADRDGFIRRHAWAERFDASGLLTQR